MIIPAVPIGGLCHSEVSNENKDVWVVEKEFVAGDANEGK